MNLRWRIRRAKRAVVCGLFGHRFVEGDCTYWSGSTLRIAASPPVLCARCGDLQDPPYEVPADPHVQHMTVFARKLTDDEIRQLYIAGTMRP